jgi:hypothetical protein
MSAGIAQRTSGTPSCPVIGFPGQAQVILGISRVTVDAIPSKGEQLWLQQPQEKRRSAHARAPASNRQRRPDAAL